ncbi:MAG: hypothetical protein FWG29_03130 [Treponema sp.]|nr:hypothetical protein [Treponema sp.]
MIFWKKKYLLLIVIFLTGKLFSLDLMVIGGLGNFSFDTSSESAIGAGKFKGSFFPLGLISIEDQITDTFGYTATAERDPVLRNILSCEMTIDAGLLQFSVGPLFSMFNSMNTFIRPGVYTSLGMEIPGIFFINLRGGATFGSSIENDYGMETSRIALGFWLPNLLSTLSVSSGKFSEFDTILIQDEFFRASYRADIYAKNVSYTISIEMGYQSLKRTYPADEDLIRAVFIGFETNVTIKPQFTFILGAEAPIFVWGKTPLEKAKDRMFFRAFTGFRWNIQRQNDEFIPLENMAEE